MEVKIGGVDMKKLSLGIIIFILAVPAFGERYIVDAYGTGDYATIQDAVSAVRAGDVIVLKAGTYSGKGNCNIDYRGKDITIRSVNPDDPACVEKTVIDCKYSGLEQNRAFIFQSGETESSVVEGITIQNGHLETGQAGAGIFCTNASSPVIENCIFRNCTVSLGIEGGSGGGAIACLKQSSPYINGCIFSGNKSKSSQGGAIFSDESSPTVENCIFRNNTSSSDGGAIWVSSGKLSIYGSELSDNQAGEEIANGGAISAFSCNLIIERCDIINNAIAENSVGKGGALSINNCTARIVDSDVSSNEAYDGGGIYCTNATQINIEGCQINKNNASLSEKVWGRNEGGGIFCENTELKMRNCVISSNQAHGSNSKTTGYGGGVFMYSGSGSFTNCLFAGNVAWADNSDAENGCGGGLYAPQTTIDINNCTFAHNTAKPEGQGSGFYSNGGPTVINSIFWGNTGSESDSQIYDPSVKVTNSNIQGGWPGKDNINADPCFVSSQKGKYYLSQTSGGQTFQSQCVDKGSDTAENLGMDLLTTSTRGIYDSGIVDMGYHYVDANVPGLDATPERIIIEFKQDREKPESQTITITNSGNGTLHWTAITDVNWLILDMDSGTCEGYGDFSVINVDVDEAGLDEGKYIGNIIISDPYARNSPKQIMVELIEVGAVLGLSQYQFYIDANRADDEPIVETLSIFNTGGSVLSWNLSDPCDWLRVEPDSGSTTNEIDDVNIIIDTSGLNKGTHTCMLTVTAEDVNNSPQTVEVQLNVVGSIIQLSQDCFDFESQQDGENPPIQKLTIQNAGGGVLNWKIKEQSHWLSVEPKFGSTANDVNVAVDISGLESGIYTGRFEVYSDDDITDNQTVTVRLVVINYNAMDLDKNLTVDFSDFAILASHLSRKTEAPAATERRQASPDKTSIKDVNDSTDFETLGLFCRNWLDTEYLELKIPNLVSHWKLDGDVKDSAGSNHGVKYGGKWTEGKIKQGLDFEKMDDRVVIEDDDSLTPSEEFTIAFWIYYRDNNGGGIYKAFDCDNFPMTIDEFGSYSLQITPDYSLVKFTVFESDNQYSVISFNPVSTNSWHHIAATFNRLEAKVYIDGVLKGSLEMKMTSIKNDSQPLRFGCRWEQCDKDKNSINAKSILDNIRIYSRALTDNEVKTLYNWER
jgi:hypothetical protein